MKGYHKMPDGTMMKNSEYSTLKDSVNTSVTLKLYKTKKASLFDHIHHSQLVSFPLSILKNLGNFNIKRLSSNPYPNEDRPRGQADLDSVLHHRRVIHQQGSTDPIWVLLKGGVYTLLDGAHRIVAAYLEHKDTIPAYIVQAS